MFDFEYPIYLCLLAVGAVIFALYLWARISRRKKLRRFGRPEVIAALMPDASRYKPGIKITLELIALAALVVVLARPRAGSKAPETEKTAGIEVMIAFDVSNSMLASASDDPGGISRINRARLLLQKMIDRLDNDKVGLIVFAGEAKTQMPLSPDFYTAKMMLNELGPNKVTYQGTSITDAINLACDGFSKAENVGRSVILITDAEDHEGDAVKAAKEAAEHGIQVNVVGVGGSKGMPIPIQGGSGSNRYLKDMNGEEVRTAFNEEAARGIARAGQGVYVNGASSSALDDLMKNLDNLDKTEIGKVRYMASAEQFPVFAWLALILLVADVFVLDRKIGWLKNINFFTKKPARASQDSPAESVKKPSTSK